MGATDFYFHHRCDPEKVSAQEAFDEARADARHEHGHGGYTGTIAEKNNFRILDPGLEADSERVKWAQDLVYNDDERVRDKWGPAGCVRLSTGWYFFGIASE